MSTILLLCRLPLDYEASGVEFYYISFDLRDSMKCLHVCISLFAAELRGEAALGWAGDCFGAPAACFGWRTDSLFYGRCRIKCPN